jgi:bifunctional DNase/RNase
MSRAMERPAQLAPSLVEMVQEALHVRLEKHVVADALETFQAALATKKHALATDINCR